MYKIVKNSNGYSLAGCSGQYLWLKDYSLTFDTFDEADELLVSLDIAGIAHIERTVNNG